MKTVRQRILEFIQSHRAVTAIEVSQAFRMTEANARHHLNILMKQGTILVIDQKASSGRGRPARVFAISKQLLGDNLDLLTNVLLHLVASNSSNNPKEHILEEIARRMAEKMTANDYDSSQTGPLSSSFTRKLNRLTLILNQCSYESRWEAHKDAPHLILNHCPYAAILIDHPEICLIDANLIQNILGSSVVQTAKLLRDSTGLQHCIFRVGKERI